MEERRDLDAAVKGVLVMASARFVLTLSSVWGHCNDLQGFSTLFRVCVFVCVHTRSTVKPSFCLLCFFFLFLLLLFWPHLSLVDDAGCCCCRYHHLFKCAQRSPSPSSSLPIRNPSLPPEREKTSQNVCCFFFLFCLRERNEEKI